jgi:hypothetical protein
MKGNQKGNCQSLENLKSNTNIATQVQFPLFLEVLLKLFCSDPICLSYYSCHDAWCQSRGRLSSYRPSAEQAFNSPLLHGHHKAGLKPTRYFHYNY